MNRLAQELAAIAASERLAEKWLVAPSYRVGNQWIETVVRNGTPAVNIRVKTLKGMALELAGSSLAARERELLSNMAGSVLTDRVISRLQLGSGGPATYLSRLLPGPSLARTLHQSLIDLRLAGVVPEKVDPAAFSDRDKGRGLAGLLVDWLREIDAAGFIDYAEILRLAIEKIEHDAGAIPGNVLLLVPADTAAAFLERRLLDAFPADRIRDLAFDAPSPAGSAAVRFFHAEGETNEVREVLRRCLSEGIPLDQVELLHTSADTYIPRLFETFARLVEDQKDYELDLPVTFAEGIPARYSRPGRALEAWISWIDEDFLQERLVRMIRDGLLLIPPGDEMGVDEDETAFSPLADRLRTVPVGKGSERYATRLEETRKALEQRKENLLAKGEDAKSKEVEEVVKGLSELDQLGSLIKSLLALDTGKRKPGPEVLDDAKRFLRETARGRNRFDNLARQRLLSRIDRMRSLLEGEEETGRVDVRQWLAALPGEIRVGGSGPRPGRLHVAHFLSGGHSGRENTFIVGLDDNRFPGAGLQDPVLLDRERKGISRELPTAAARLKKQVDDFALLMGRLRGTVSLGFSCRCVVEDREVFPSPAVLAAFRTAEGREEANLADLTEHLGTPASFAPLDRKSCLHEGEWWLWRLLGPTEVEEPRSLVCSRFPSLENGFVAEAGRAGDLFTPFDGFVPEAGRRLDPFTPEGAVMSGSSLETIGRCPLSYFFRYGLKIRPLEVIELAPDQWLDGSKSGTLLHEVFREFMDSLVKDGRLPPSFDRDRAKLHRILDRCIEENRERYPPFTESIFQKERRELMKVSDIFLRVEEDVCLSSRPRFLEVAVGLRPEGPGTDLDRQSSLEVELVPGRTIRVRGRIDRIDEVVGGDGKSFIVRDYKTGSPRRYTDAKGAFDKGRIVQHGLYLAMAKKLLESKVDPEARVRKFGYSFPGLTARGRQIAWKPEDLASWGAVAALLCTIVSEGSFLPVEKKDKPCRFCDFKPICSDTAASAAASLRKLENEENGVLGTISEVRKHE